MVRRALVWGIAAVIAACLTAHAEGTLEFDQYGGLRTPNFGPGKFFRTYNDGQRWWLVTPDGGAFLSLGVNNVNPAGDVERGTNRQPYRENVLAKRGSVEAWTSVTHDRLKEWGTNTLGAWTSGELRNAIPYTIELSVGSGLWGGRHFPDLFTTEAEEFIRKRAAAAEATANDPFLLGYYLDNELAWSYDYRRIADIFPSYVALPPGAPGKRKLMEFFQERYSSVENFCRVWGPKLKSWDDLASAKQLKPRIAPTARADREAFELIVARQYFKTATEAVRAKDPNHLVLGCRFVWVLAPKPAIQACGEFCDVVSINYYEAGVLGKFLLWCTEKDSLRVASDLSFKPFHDLTNKPLIITEFGFRAIDSGLPNTYPPGWLLQPRVTTQKDRADKFEECATTWMSQPYFLGYHWFEYVDEPKGGRFDGENGNYGLVKTDDEPYSEFVTRFQAMNRRAWDLHAGSGKPQ